MYIRLGEKSKGWKGNRSLNLICSGSRLLSAGQHPWEEYLVRLTGRTAIGAFQGFKTTYRLLKKCAKRILQT